VLVKNDSSSYHIRLLVCRPQTPDTVSAGSSHLFCIHAPALRSPCVLVRGCRPSLRPIWYANGRRDFPPNPRTGQTTIFPIPCISVIQAEDRKKATRALMLEWRWSDPHVRIELSVPRVVRYFFWNQQPLSTLGDRQNLMTSCREET
jgi:hypothetical protein